MAKYAIGVDFGTLSARALVVEIGSGREVSTAVKNYPHGVLDEALPTGEKLQPGFALQHPSDYLECLGYVIPEVLKRSGVSKEDVVGLGIDFTACTMLTVDEAGTPLCLTDEFARDPLAWVLLWKHHGAQEEARRMTEIISRIQPKLLENFGGKIFSEWMLPKIWEVLNESPKVFDKADRFIEAGDWLVERLTGAPVRSAVCAGYKALWNRHDGYLADAILRAMDPRLEGLGNTKLRGQLLPLGARAGGLTREAAEWLGLMEDTSVAVFNVDAHVGLPAAGEPEKGNMMMILGTSTVDLMVSDLPQVVPGMCGISEDGILPGQMVYEAGQSCVGDQFNWFVENCVPEAYAKEAQEKGIDLHALLTQKAEALRPGESGLVALDWWNGNRSVLWDADLTGLMLGMSLTTKPEEIYRALIESTAYGARMILDTFDESGVPVKKLMACGGIAHKNPFLMQLYADVLNREICVIRSTQAPALGSALYASLAAGAARGGYDDLRVAAREMGGIDDRRYAPDPERAKIYEALYREYCTLHDWFGRGGNDVMKRLIALRQGQQQ